MSGGLRRLERVGTDRLEAVEAEVAVLRQLVWRLITLVPGGVEDARTTMRLMLSGSRRHSATIAVNAIEMLSRLPAAESPTPSLAAPALAAPALAARPPAAVAWPLERRVCKTCPDCGPDMLITVLIEDDGPHLPPGARRHLLRCLGCRHEESRVVEAPGR